jgi:opacity protein-like surface antigen
MVLVDGVLGLPLDFDETRTFEEFVEQGSLSNHYSYDTGFGVYGGIQYDFVPRFGLRAAFSYVKRNGSARFEGQFPHPLFFERPREASGELSDLSHGETSGHLDLVYTAHAGAVDISLFAGGSIMQVESDLIGVIEKTETYPYDTVEVTGATTITVSDSPFGFNVGAGIDFRVSDSVGLGAQFFFSRAVAKLEPTPGSTFEFDAGGGHVTAGVRIKF